MAMRKGARNYISVIFSVVHKSKRAKKGCPALILEVSSCKIGVTFGVSLLLSQYRKVNSTFGIFRHLKKVAIISNLVN